MSVANSCQLLTLFIGITEVCYSSRPVGQCSYCCPADGTVDIQYKLFTRANPRIFQVLQPGTAADLQRSAFDFTRSTIIYLMGFSESTNGPSTTTLRDTYLTAGDYNFIAVDWSRLIAFPWYITAVRNTHYMGMHLANFVEFLQRAGVPASSLHVIGFSLGAEAAGFAGKDLRARGIRLGRITGLDPAYPGYRFTNRDGHLSKGDALFVDVIHSNPGILGFPQPLGDVDFYANPGSWIQPGCWVNQLIRNNQLRYIYGCSHNRAWRLYAESILNPTGFPATLCRSWRRDTDECSSSVDGYLGFAARPPMAGKMFVETNERPPFARNVPTSSWCDVRC
ncbi:pancreatic lipase-related protein 2 [Ostrinia nubilalis]|uniref:pancreatic lipase-related protein 2 n=1 Tax=Ostrinia nubilalis TaxID=29057 RepID=UPI003082566B